MTKHRNVTLAIDIMYINWISFSKTASRAINYGMADLIRNEKLTTIMTAIKQVNYSYQASGY